MKKIQELNIEQIKNQFELENGINKNEIEQMPDYFIRAGYSSLQTKDKDFIFIITNYGKAKKNSFEQKF